MEHRLSQRIEGELPILVYKRGMPVATGAIKDASRRGLFIGSSRFTGKCWAVAEAECNTVIDLKLEHDAA